MCLKAKACASEGAESCWAPSVCPRNPNASHLIEGNVLAHEQQTTEKAEGHAAPGSPRPAHDHKQGHRAPLGPGRFRRQHPPLGRLCRSSLRAADPGVGP